MFTPQLGVLQAHNDGGLLLGHTAPGVPIYPLFWGTWWLSPDGQAALGSILNAIDPIFHDSPFLDGLHQYGITQRAFLGNHYISGLSDPPQAFSNSNLGDFVWNAIDNFGFPEPDDYSNEGIYTVFTPPGIPQRRPDCRLLPHMVSGL